MSEIQEFYVSAINLALGAGFFGLGLIVFLLALIAVRSMGSR